MTRPPPKIDKDMGPEVEKLGGYRPQNHRLLPQGTDMSPRRVAYTEIVNITILAAPRRRPNRLYTRGLS
jgi:hypothetical protein